MIPFSWTIRLVLTLIFISNLVEGESCTLTPIAEVNGECTAEINCRSYFEVNLKTWDCIKSVAWSNDYDEYGDYDGRSEVVTYASIYNLIVDINNSQEVNIFHKDQINNIIKLTVDDGALLIIPQEVYSMSRLQVLSITGSKISSINLNEFLSMSLLNKINLANNSISYIYTDDKKEVSSGHQSNVKLIDISNNSIEVVPNMFLSNFIWLQHLNMSHNLISSIGILTFEGIMQLQSLDISHNRLFEVGNAFARFVNLRDLTMSHNNLTKLIDFDFVTLTNLETLDVSFNNINTIENRTFQSLRKLKLLNLEHNKIDVIFNQFFERNINMYSLSLLDNQIRFIQANSFKNQHLTEFYIQNNCLTGALDENTFKGLHVLELNLSGGNLTSIKDEAFTNMYELINLNLSSNAISSVSTLAFSSLVSLDVLDMSHNQLTELYFVSYNLKNLTILYAHHNKIGNVTKYVFENLVSLKLLDLSFNELKEIEHNSFSELKTVELLILTSSHFVNSLGSRSLEGLASLQKVDMSGTNTTRFQNESFAGLVSLTNIYSAYGHLVDIEYNAFIGTESLKILTLSYNQICYFHVNTSTISQIQEIYLNNNLLRNVSDETFSNLAFLRNLNLANNDILKLGSGVFQYSKALLYLNLSSNARMEIDTNAFYYLNELKSLSLHNIKTEINFQNSSADIEELELQSCGINNINNVYIFNVHGIAYLNISMNNIVTIDKDSFRNMPSLHVLDLSLNKLMQIQPGSFFNVRKLEILNLSGNNLPLIQYGVFDGMEGLRDLDLSDNVLTHFDVKLVQQSRLTKLYLDDNLVNYLNFNDFYNAGISKLSIGGNQVPCQILAELNVSNISTKLYNIVTTKNLNFHLENVNGISCHSNSNEKSIFPVSYNTSVNFSPLISSLRNALNRFSESMQHSKSEFSSNTVDLIKVTKNVDKTLNSFIESSDKHQIMNANFLSKITDINNDTNTQIRDIKNYLMTLTETKYEAEPEVTLNPKVLDDQYNKVRSEFQKMLKEESNALTEEFKTALASISKD